MVLLMLEITALTFLNAGIVGLFEKPDSKAERRESFIRTAACGAASVSMFYLATLA